jgi:hypothetical protein
MCVGLGMTKAERLKRCAANDHKECDFAGGGFCCCGKVDWLEDVDANVKPDPNGQTDEELWWDDRA